MKVILSTGRMTVMMMGRKVATIVGNGPRSAMTYAWSLREVLGHLPVV